MAKPTRGHAGGSGRAGQTARIGAGRRLLQMGGIVVAIGAAVGLLVRSQREAGSGEGGFKQVGRNGPVFTVSVAPAKTADEAFLMHIAEQLSAQEVQAGGSGQISVMVWPDNVAVPKQPPTTEFDASMKTQAAGIFINPKLNVKHVIRFKDGQTVSERDFGKKNPIATHESGHLVIWLSGQ